MTEILYVINNRNRIFKLLAREKQILKQNNQL